MANLKSAKKQARQNIVRRARNTARRSEIKTAVKKVLTSLDAGDNFSAVSALLRDAEAKIARAKGKGLLHRNNAARKVSRLAKRVAAIVKKK